MFCFAVIAALQGGVPVKSHTVNLESFIAKIFSDRQACVKIKCAKICDRIW